LINHLNLAYKKFFEFVGFENLDECASKGYLPGIALLDTDHFKKVLFNL
jgi:hypothetical protein